jgi:hypothetical protein
VTSAKDAVAIASRVVPKLSVRARALVVAIGGLETHWGDAFRQPDGTASNNWGAITKGSGWTGQTFEHVDTRWNGTDNESYTTEFRVYPSPLAGAQDLANLLRSHYRSAVAAAERGDWHAVSAELYKGGYYSGKAPAPQAIADHYSAIKKQLAAIGITPGVVVAAAGLEWLLWIGVGWLLLRHKRRSH